MHAPTEITPSVIRNCRGSKSCSHAVLTNNITKELDDIVEETGWPAFLLGRYNPLRHHHQFRLAVSSCPNGCTQPHIADFALIAHRELNLSPEKCTQCGECIDTCAERAVSLSPLEIDTARCAGCGDCTVCGFDAIRAAHVIYRVIIGGKLGRHPRLGHELGKFELPEAMVILRNTLQLYMKQHRPGMRLGDLVQELGEDTFNRLVQP